LPPGEFPEPEKTAGVYKLGRSVMILRFLLMGCLFGAAPPLFGQAASQPTIRKVLVLGNVRVPTATILHYVSAAPDATYGQSQAHEDLCRLHALGIFETLEIQTQDDGIGGIDVIYRVRERPFVSEFAIDGVSAAQGEQIRRLLEREKLWLQPATPFHPGAANKAALSVRAYMRARKYPFSEVRVQTAQEKGSALRVILHITPGPRMDIGKVQFLGNQSIPSRDLLKQMPRTRPALIQPLWIPTGAFMIEKVIADLENLRRHYQSQGFAAVAVGQPRTIAQEFPRRWWMPLPSLGGPKQKLSLMIPLTEGPRFTLASVESEGDGKSAASEVAAILAAVKTPAAYDADLLESTRRQIVDVLGQAGYALAQVQLDQAVNDADRTVRAHFRISPGEPVTIGRIDFQGNARLRDKFLRREVVAREGEIFDSAKLDRSVERLNRSGLIQEIQRSDLILEMNEKTAALDVTFKIKEKERQGIYATGGTGGIGGGYLGLLYTGFDLLGLGEALSLEVDGGASQSNVLLNVVGSRFLGFPFTLGLSVFHRLTHINVASLVPDTDDLLHLLRHRSTGMSLSGAYAVTSRAQVGLGARFEQSTISENGVDGSSQAQDSVQRRTELTPSFVFNDTVGTGPATRGMRFAAATSWAGSPFLRSIDSTSQTMGLAKYLDDPYTKGRNAFAFHFQAAFTRPRNGVPLTLDRRFFPGDEIVRGFPRGGMSPWAYPSDPQLASRPAGADTVLGFSAEYRIPIQGPLSAAAFVDLGWSSLSGKSAALDTGSRLISSTNRLWRASVGGEFRLQLPVLRQPGRLIFSWNPLRLDKLIGGLSSPLHLADPRGSIRFALGDRF
jgi:outer membrane protein insertion porin family